ncbi:single-stranded DNA-binding protein [Achromobacter xylosoxidans]|uniref:single-stranded DNA-binding protein n=1 Tax=Alcaligenes xylosoxydans xylosoxydans TaxID=85698 RepID=UPI0012AA8DC2|nr:single-stranded DNA-binding protein [Achromobacter xylosoxidans]CUR70318.1 Helix-destabilizing protein [Achromobacter xylosoxidans]
MANDLNKCMFIGRLGRDPEVRYIGDGTPVCSFSLAVGWKTSNKDGTEWIPAVAFGKLAEICGEYLSKGKQVYVEGRWNTQKFQDKETGADRYQTRLVLDQMQMLGSKDDAAPATAKPAAKPATKPAPKPTPEASHTNVSDLDDDIPF